MSTGDSERIGGGFIEIDLQDKSAKGLEDLKQRLAVTGGKIQELESKTRQASAATEVSGRHAGMAAMKWMLLAQTLDDAQYGFRAIVNNIPMVAGAFLGFSGPLAAGIAIAAVALNQILIHFKEIVALFGVSEGDIDRFWRSVGLGADEAAEHLKKFQAEQEKVMEGFRSRLGSIKGTPAEDKDVAEGMAHIPGGPLALARRLVYQEMQRNPGKFMTEIPAMPWHSALTTDFRKIQATRVFDQKKVDERIEQIQRIFGQALEGDADSRAQIYRVSKQLGQEIDNAIARRAMRDQEVFIRGLEGLNQAGEDFHQNEIQRAAAAALAGPQRLDILRGGNARRPPSVAAEDANLFNTRVAQARAAQIDRQAEAAGTDRKTAQKVLEAEALREQNDQRIRFIQDQITINGGRGAAAKYGGWGEGMWAVQAAALNAGDPAKEQIKQLQKANAKLDQQILLLKGLDPRMKP